MDPSQASAASSEPAPDGVPTGEVGVPPTNTSLSTAQDVPPASGEPEDGVTNPAEEDAPEESENGNAPDANGEGSGEDEEDEYESSVDEGAIDDLGSDDDEYVPGAEKDDPLQMHFVAAADGDDDVLPDSPSMSPRVKRGAKSSGSNKRKKPPINSKRPSKRPRTQNAYNFQKLTKPQLIAIIKGPVFFQPAGLIVEYPSLQDEAIALIPPKGGRGDAQPMSTSEQQSRASPPVGGSMTGYTAYQTQQSSHHLPSQQHQSHPSMLSHHQPTHQHQHRGHPQHLEHQQMHGHHQHHQQHPHAQQQQSQHMLHSMGYGHPQSYQPMSHQGMSQGLPSFQHPSYANYYPDD